MLKLRADIHLARHPRVAVMAEWGLRLSYPRIRDSNGLVNVRRALADTKSNRLAFSSSRDYHIVLVLLLCTIFRRKGYVQIHDSTRRLPQLLTHLSK